MATEKDKTIPKFANELCRLMRLSDSGKWAAQFTMMACDLWEAARADAIEECAKIADSQKTFDDDTWSLGNDSACKSIADELRSLSRKQEEPR